MLNRIIKWISLSRRIVRLVNRVLDKYEHAKADGAVTWQELGELGLMVLEELDREGTVAIRFEKG
jgi:hypothetical protein